MSAMNLARLAELLDAYGASPQRWPEAERAAAEQLLALSAEAGVLRDRAARLDAALDEFLVVPADRQLRARILASYPPAPMGWRHFLAELWQDLGGSRLVAPAFAASLALGAVMPGWWDQSPTDLPDEDLIASVLLADNDTEVQP